MPDELTDRIQRVPDGLPAVVWAPAQELRRTGRRRRQTRLAALTVAATAAVATAVVVTAGTVRSTGPADAPAAAPCTVIPKSALALPNPDEVTVVVINATGHPDHLDGLVRQFRDRRFTATGVNAPGNHDGTAVIRYGPKAVGAAWLLRGSLLDRASLEFDPNRMADAVEVLLGRDFTQLATITETNWTLAQLGPVTAPSGACPQS